MIKYYDIIKKSHFTEKTSNIEVRDIKCTNSNVVRRIFTLSLVIDNNATKDLVSRAVEYIFKTKVLKVNIINISGKKKRFKNYKYYKSDIKKAIVRVLTAPDLSELREIGIANGEDFFVAHSQHVEKHTNESNVDNSEEQNNE